MSRIGTSLVGIHVQFFSLKTIRHLQIKVVSTARKAADDCIVYNNISSAQEGFEDIPWMLWSHNYSSGPRLCALHFSVGADLTTADRLPSRAGDSYYSPTASSWSEKWAACAVLLASWSPLQILPYTFPSPAYTFCPSHPARWLQLYLPLVFFLLPFQNAAEMKTAIDRTHR